MATKSDLVHETSDGDRRLLTLDDDLFVAYFDRHPFKIKHALVGHPLLQLPRLVELARSQASPILPGEGVHIPPCHPHWVQNGGEVSISLGILWFSDVTARRRHLHRVNQWLKRAGLKPAMPGERPLSDSVKALPQTIKRRLRRWWRR